MSAVLASLLMLHTTLTRVLWRLAVVATAASGVVHAVTVPHHAGESLLFEVFFFVSA
jgi:hypothetical protein